jgi:thymidine kinase
MASFRYFTGPMDCGKSTLALQIDHTHAGRGRRGRLFTSRDRAGEAIISSRLGLRRPAVEVHPTFGFWTYVVEQLSAGARIDYVICDETQFYTPEQVDDLARLVDELDIDVFAVGILTDFQTHLFPGSRRLVELCDSMEVLQVEALCWCGRRATHNARTVDGLMVVEGAQVVVGDTYDLGEPSDSDPEADSEPGAGAHALAYEVLCRRHHRSRTTRLLAQAGVADTLPFETVAAKR